MITATTTTNREVSHAEVRELRQHLEHLAGLVATFRYASGPQSGLFARLPPEEIREAWRSVWEFVGERVDHEWPRQCWRCLEKINDTAKALESAIKYDPHQWFTGEWPTVLVVTYPSLLAELSSDFDQPKPLPPARRQAIESLNDLDRQGLSDRQIAMCWGWKDSTGYGDHRKVQRVRNGELKEPEFIILPAYDDGLPVEQPTIEHVAAICRCLPAE